MFVVGKRFWRGGNGPRISKTMLPDGRQFACTDTTANVVRQGQRA
jgi:hypothetical protein